MTPITAYEPYRDDGLGGDYVKVDVLPTSYSEPSTAVEVVDNEYRWGVSGGLRNGWVRPESRQSAFLPVEIARWLGSIPQLLRAQGSEDLFLVLGAVPSRSLSGVVKYSAQGFSTS